MEYFNLKYKNLNFFNALDKLDRYRNKKAFIVYNKTKQGLYFDDNGNLQSININTLNDYNMLKMQEHFKNGWYLYTTTDKKYVKNQRVKK